MTLRHLLLALSLGTSLLLPACAWTSKSDYRFCPVRNFLNEAGQVDQQYWAVERECLKAQQKLLDAAYGE
jgi:hypothetical protein